MYSYEDRIRAVELYIKLGKRVRPAIRQLGNPTKNSMKGWYNEYQQKLDLPAGYAGRRPKFSREQKSGSYRALPHSRPLHCCHHEGIGLSRQRDTDRVGSRGCS